MKNLLTCLLKISPQARTAFAIQTSFWLALFAIAPSACATAYVSAATGNWATTTTWTPNGTPGAADSVEILSGNVVTAAAGVTVGLVTIDSGGTLAIAASSSAGLVTNNGTLKIGTGTTARTLTITTNLVNNGTINGDTGLQNQILFNKSGGTTLWLGSGDISAGKILLGVAANTTLNISGLTTAVTFRSGGTMASTISGTLITGTQVISGNGNTTCSLTLASGATLITANPNGIINGTLGTINFAGTVTLNTAANYVFNGSSAQITTGLPATVNNLTITNAAGVTLNAATAVNGTLTLSSGVLTTTSGTTPTAAAVVSTGGGYVSGPLAEIYSGAGSKTFPVGKGGSPRSVTLNYTALTGSSTVTMEQFESAMGGTLPGNTTQFASRYWTVSQTGGSGLSFDLTLDGTGYSPAATAVMLRQGTPDTSYSTSFASPNYTASGISAVGNFTLGNYTPVADQLAFTTSAQTLTAGVTSGTFTVQLQDGGGTPKNTVADLTLNLGSSSGAGVFRNTADTATITSVTITAGNNSASFKYQDTIAPASPTLTASATGANPATQQQTVNVSAASKLMFTTQPASTNLAATLAAVVVRVQDQFGNLVAQSGTAVTLTLNNGGSSALTGTNPQNTDGSGAATFNDLAVMSAPGTGLNLTATGGGLTQAISGNFDIASKSIVKALNNTALNLTGSWTGGVVPGTNDTAQIDNTSVGTGANNSPDVGDNASWYGLKVIGWSAGHGYTVTDTGGGHTITLGAGGLVGTTLTHSIFINNGFVLGDNQTWNWGSGPGPLTVNGNIDNGGYHFSLNVNQTITVGGTIDGAGDLTKTGTGTLTLNAANTYSGNTVVSNGTLTLGASGILASNVIVASGGTLTGAGTVNGPTTVNGTLAPGLGAIGTLTFNNGLTLNSGSTNLFELNNSLSPSNDVVAVTGSIIAGGSLVVTNLGPVLADGDSFALFSHSVSGSFGSLVLPSLPSGFVWTNRLAIDGSIAVVQLPTVNTNPTNITATVSGGDLILQWPADHTGWTLQVQTNSLNVGLNTNWSSVAGSALVNSVTNAINPENGAVFYRMVYP